MCPNSVSRPMWIAKFAFAAHDMSSIEEAVRSLRQLVRQDPRLLFHRIGLSSKRRFSTNNLFDSYTAIRGNHVSGLQKDHISWDDISRNDVLNTSVPQHIGLGSHSREQSLDCP